MTDQKKPDEKPEDKKPSAGPVPSSAMYIGLCQTRAQAAVLRWQYAIVFMAFNGVVGGWCVPLVDKISVYKVGGLTFIAAAMIFVNLLFRGLVDRANQWIDYFTVATEDVEKKFGTETGVLVFASKEYPGKEEMRRFVRGWRFRDGIRILSDAMVGTWVIVFFIAFAWTSILIGQGKFL